MPQLKWTMLVKGTMKKWQAMIKINDEFIDINFTDA